VSWPCELRDESGTTSIWRGFETNEVSANRYTAQEVDSLDQTHLKTPRKWLQSGAGVRACSAAGHG
jgi:hypothetical protein